MSERFRRIARDLFLEAMEQTTVRAAVERGVSVNDGVLHAGEFRFALRGFQRVFLISMGKAGATLFDAVRPLLTDCGQVRSVVAAPRAPLCIGPDDLCFVGGHPLPNAESMRAADAAIELLKQADADTFVLFFISGGASAMFEAPLDNDLTLSDLLELNALLVGSGLPIQQINCVRKHLSLVKGGRLAQMSAQATSLTLLISDVPDDALDALASGPTLPDTTTADECVALLTLLESTSNRLPARIARYIHSGLPETPKPGDTCFEKSQAVVLLSNGVLLQALSLAAERQGFHVVIDNGCDDFDYRDAAAYLLDRFQRERLLNRRLCLLSGGEVTVQLPAEPGVGGRNQQWALEFARQLALGSEAVTVLSAGSDGIDGTSPAAGCVVDETTSRRAEESGLDLQRSLLSFNAFPLLETLGDAIITGPSGNNLRDVRMLLFDPET